ncbi:MAG: 50S ribosomal protein L25 [bacterium]
MVEKLKIHAKERDLSVKTNNLRKTGAIPAILYSKGKEALPISIDAHEFELCYREAGGNTIVAIDIDRIDGSEAKRNALIHELAHDPVTDRVLHADFLQIRMDEKITAEVPLKFIGDSVAVIELGGSLLTHTDSIEVECLPADMPHEIEVDLAPLNDFESNILISDLKIPENVTILDELDEVVAYVEAPRSEEELAELEEPIVPEAEMPPSEHGEEEPKTDEDEITKDDKTE